MDQDNELVKKLLLPTLFLSVLVIGCKNPGILPIPELSSTRDFYCQKFDGSNLTYTVTATLMAQTDHSAVYVEPGRGITTQTAQFIAQEFENAIYGSIRNTFAYESDVDGNGRIILFLLDIVDGYSGSGGYIGGYFYGGDTLDQAGSNRADMIYLDVDPVTAGGPEFFQIIAHEFQHLVNFAETYIRGGGTWFDTWINEGLSAAAEYVYSGEYDSSRLNYDKTDPYGSIENGNTFFVWGNGDIYDLLADYSSVYLFFQWLRLHSSNGPGIYSEILHSSYMDVQSVVNAVKNRIYGGAAIEWYQILRDWKLAFRYEDNTGLYGFSGEIDVGIHDYNASEIVKDLLPGESIYRLIPISPYSPTSPPAEIHYLGIDIGKNSSDDGARDEIGSDYDGNLLLVWNGSDNRTDTEISAPIPEATFISTPDVNASYLSGYSPPTRYPVGVTFDDPTSGRMRRDDK